MNCSSDYLWHAANHLCGGGAAAPWTEYKLALLATDAGSVPRRRGASLEDVTLALEDLVSVTPGGAAVTPYSPPEWIDPDEPPDPPTNPEVLPVAEIEIAAETWTNETEGTVTARCVAVVGWNPDAGSAGRWELLFWRALSPAAEIEPEGVWPEEADVLIVRITEIGDTPDETAAELVYETANHGTAAQHAEVEDRPTQWRDFEDDTIGTRFAAFFLRLERFLYAVCGSVPKDATHNWWHRQHPRCLWWPEQRRRAWCGYYSGDTPDCDAYVFKFAETAAMGDSWQDRIPSPRVPLRSASEDHKAQVLDETRPRDREHFPRMSVVRDETFDGNADIGVYTADWDGRSLFDPKGTGDFGGDPDAAGGDGEDHVDGDPVEVRYAPPPGRTVLSATLHYTGGSSAMGESAGVWSATIPAQNHGTKVHWYLEVAFDGGDDPDYILYEPGGESAPAGGTQYSYVAFTHYQPYARGLPELWDKCRKGTRLLDDVLIDGYAFAGDETVQYELINLARFTLDYLGARFVHSPRLREGMPTCCLHLPIVFRWSGSARWPHYVGGGKDGVQPVHDRDEEGDYSTLARSSWRGVPAPYGEAGGLSSFEHPAGAQQASWLAPPAQVDQLVNWSASPPPPTCETYWDGAERGLQRGDVIDEAHINELIAALDYLIDNGLWSQCPVKRHKATPISAFHESQSCGDGRAIHTYSYDPGSNTDDTSHDDTLGCWEECTRDGGDVVDCVPFAPPADWAECFAGESTGICEVTQFYETDCSCQRGDGVSGGEQCETTRTIRTGCVGGWSDVDHSSDPQLCPAITVGGGGQVAQNCAGQTVDDFGMAAHYDEVGRECQHFICGSEFWMCSPQRCPNGPDESHGNGLGKERYRGSGPPDPCEVRVETGGGVPYSMGNCRGDAYYCGYNLTDEVQGIVGLEEIVRFRYTGWTQAAVCSEVGCGDSECPCEDYSADGLPEFPGYVSRWDWNEPPVNLCGSHCLSEVILDDETGHAETFSADGNCVLDVSGLCNADLAWCAIDLNLDDTGTPYSNFGLGGYGGERMPTLRDYDLSSPVPDPLTWPPEEGPYELQTACPCDTLGAPGCEEF